MRGFGTFGVVCFLVPVAFAAVALGPVRRHPDHPGKCWVEDLQQAFPVGGNWSLGDCSIGICGSDRVEYQSCGAVAGPSHCTTVEDLSLPYPLCCPEIRCPEEQAPRESFPEYDYLGESGSQQDLLNSQEDEDDVDDLDNSLWVLAAPQHRFQLNAVPAARNSAAYSAPNPWHFFFGRSYDSSINAL